MVSSRTYLRDRGYLSASMGHFFVDVLNNSRTLLIAILAVQLDLTNSQVGIVLLLYNVGSSLLQPLFGWWADKIGARPLVVWGIGWMVVFYAIAAVGSPWVAIVASTAAGFGSGAFHPAGTKVASASSTESRAQATAYFFMAGQIGLFLGPIIAGGLLDGFGRIGYALLPFLSLFSFISSCLYVRSEPVVLNKKGDGGVVSAEKISLPLRASLCIALLMAMINIVTISTMNFAPKHFAELNYSATYTGWVAGIIMLGYAAGGIVGGNWADRLLQRSGDIRPVVLIGLIGMTPPIFLYLETGDLTRLILLAFAGFCAGMPHSPLILYAQSLLPGREALASGLSLGIMFTCGAIGAYIVGVIADTITLPVALSNLAIVSVLALVPAILLPRQST